MTALPPSPKIGLRVSAERKARFAALAAAHGLSESALLAQLIDHVLEACAAPTDPLSPPTSGPSSDRITLRLRPGDRKLLAARAAGRGMKPCTYLVMLVHAHLRGEAPLPVHEINWLKACIGELSALVRALQSKHDPSAAFPAEAGAVALPELTQQAVTCTDRVRQAMADLVRTNLRSWEGGHG